MSEAKKNLADILNEFFAVDVSALGDVRARVDKVNGQSSEFGVRPGRRHGADVETGQKGQSGSAKHSPQRPDAVHRGHEVNRLSLQSSVSASQ